MSTLNVAAGTQAKSRILCLGAGEGWHATQLSKAATAMDCELHVSTYESLSAETTSDGTQLICSAGALTDFDAILTRTMPAGSLEQVTFRLAVLHTLQRQTGDVAMVNPPRSLEIAIDKFATLALVSQFGYAVPATRVVQSRVEAIDAFRALGGDCVVKPIFGGEGRGVMRIRDEELAWYSFSTLERLDSVFYVQSFVPPGGRDTRLLVIGDEVIGVRRHNEHDFRTNVSSGGRCELFDPSPEDVAMAHRICEAIGLKFASVDLIDDEHGGRKVIEVNAIPGWKGAQGVLRDNIAEKIIAMLVDQANACLESPC